MTCDTQEGRSRCCFSCHGGQLAFKQGDRYPVTSPSPFPFSAPSKLDCNLLASGLCHPQSSPC